MNYGDGTKQTILSRQLAQGGLEKLHSGLYRLGCYSGYITLPWVAHSFSLGYGLLGQR